jgi:hypothetical protein
MDGHELARFYRAIWGPAGHRCLAQPYPSGKGFQHFWGATTDELLSTHKYRLRHPSMFHSVATYRRVDAGDRLKEGVKLGELRRFKQLVLWSKCGHN